jgi:acylphosphatase
MVQGVSFRAYTRTAARQFGVTGWVRNLRDGKVEALVEGDPENVNSMLVWFHKGSPFSRVDRVATYEEIPTGEFQDFDINFGYGDYW